MLEDLLFYLNKYEKEGRFTYDDWRQAHYEWVWTSYSWLHIVWIPAAISKAYMISREYWFVKWMHNNWHLYMPWVKLCKQTNRYYTDWVQTDTTPLNDYELLLAYLATSSHIATDILALIKPLSEWTENETE